MPLTTVSTSMSSTRYQVTLLSAQGPLRLEPARLDDESGDGEHLAGRLDLAPPARRDDHALHRRDHAQAGHRQLPGYDHHSNPGGQFAQFHQRDQGSRHEQLVGQRVEERADDRGLAARRAR